eukprot:TRINITY_DN163_c1_g1_i1.p1 TRINITY_DN163_c1_g1~~TRINITY_DN163_c1_g1_i1.p1  ORF type:complete len:552 (+),score=38.79 TRINITY_DN163_c1_g1_i1:670-2325(+)
MPYINPSVLNKNRNYTDKVFELKKDPGDYQPTIFETLRTEQFLANDPDPHLLPLLGRHVLDSGNVDRQLEAIYRKICLSGTAQNPAVLKVETTNEVEEDPMPHVLHGSELVASKNIWEKPKTSPRFLKLVKSHNLLAEQHKKGTAKFVDLRAPLWRKLVICLWKEGEKTAELLHAVSSAGYLASPRLIYGSWTAGSICTTDTALPINSILSQDILSSMSKTTVSIITCGFEHCTVLTSSGTVASWGYGGSGCLGHGNYTSYTSPKLIKDLPEAIVHIESGAYHTAAITEKGDLFIWGRSDVGQLGIDTKFLQKDSMGWVGLSPLEVEPFKGETRRIALGEAHTLVLNDRGELHTAGWNEHGQRGEQDSGNGFDLLKSLYDKQIVAIGAGSLFSAAVDSKGKVYTWGNNDHGQLGYVSEITDVHTPKEVGLAGEFALELCCGEASVLVYCKSGKIYGWGQGNVESIGSGDEGINKMIPELIYKVDAIQYYSIDPPPDPSFVVLTFALTLQQDNGHEQVRRCLLSAKPLPKPPIKDSKQQNHLYYYFIFSCTL